MKKAILGFALVLACVPLSACNRQHGNKNQAAQQTNAPAERMGRGHGLRRACADELQKYCATEQRGRERRQCLQSHTDQLSADCKAAIEAKGGGRRRRGF